MDETPEVPVQRSYSGLFIGVLAVAVLCAIAGLVWSYRLAGRLTTAEAQVASAQQQNQKLAAALDQFPDVAGLDKVLDMVGLCV